MINKNYITVNNWLIDPPSGSIIHVITGEKKRLGEYQLKMLEVLLDHRGVILTREELTSLVWGQRVIGNNSLPNAIHALRIALEDDGKLQKIIKTIPKKGYLLEEEYCQFPPLSSSALESATDNDNTLATFSADLSQPNARYPNLSAIQTAPLTSDNTEPVPFAVETRLDSKIKHRLQQNILLPLSLVIIVTLGVVASWYFFSKPNDQLVAIEQGESVYSNIRLYELSRSNEVKNSKYRIHDKLKDTFYILNQQLKLNSVFMTAYYNSVDQTLNYTFTLKSQCDKNQLSMAIYHWRIDSALLNNLILRETRRKLNEMAICTSN